MKKFIFDTVFNMNSNEKMLLHVNPFALFLMKILCPSIRADIDFIVLKTRFWCEWLPALWNATKAWNRQFGSIVEWKPVPNASRTCRTVQSRPSNNFKTTAWKGKNSKARKMGAAWNVAKQHYPLVEHASFVAFQAAHKRFFVKNCYWRWKVDYVR